MVSDKKMAADLFIAVGVARLTVPSEEETW
jgi:hypothetical protein